ncbi:MAG: nicotinamide mononucleotide transporter [Thermomicrobiales bacterium]
MGLQVVYLILSLYGWYEWKYGGNNRTELQLTRAPVRFLSLAAAAAVASAAILGAVLSRPPDSPPPPPHTTPPRAWRSVETPAASPVAGPEAERPDSPSSALMPWPPRPRRDPTATPPPAGRGVPR